MNIGGEAILEAAKAAALAAWPEVKAACYAVTAAQAASIVASGCLPVLIVQPGHERLDRAGGRTVAVELMVAFHYVMALQPGGVTSLLAMRQGELLMGALLDQATTPAAQGGKLGGLVETVQPAHVLFGDDNAVNMALAQTYNNVGATAVTVTATFCWSV